ncbi:hypothetical protein ACET3Z_008680 [Daucus carota]
MEKLYENDGFAVAGSENGETSNRVNTSFGDEINQTTENRKRKEPEGSSSGEQPDDGDQDDSHVQKRTRVIWTSEMHRKFVEAIAQLGEDRAFPKKILEEMNEPGLTKENVASHLQKYRLSLKKSLVESDFNAATGSTKTPYIYNSSLGNCQRHYMGTSQIGSRNYLPVSTSDHSSLYRINYTGIGSSGVRLAPPSYSPLNGSFGDHGGEKGDKLLSILNKRRCSNTSDHHATRSSTSHCAFMGLQFADDGKSLLVGGPKRSEGVPIENYSTNSDFYYQESAAPAFPSFSVEKYAQDSPLPPLPECEDYLEETTLPLPEFYVENSFPPLEDTVTSQPIITNSPWNSNMNMASDALINHEVSLPPLPSEITWDSYPACTTINSIPQTMTQHSVLPSESQWNANNEEQELLLPWSPSEIPWNLDLDPVP